MAAINLTCNLAPPLEGGFSPAVVFNRKYLEATQASGKAVPLVIGLEREQGLVSRYETVVKPEADPDTLVYVERLVKFLLWARGGWRIWLGAPKAIGQAIQRYYSASGERKFDVQLMSRVYEHAFEVVPTDPDSIPAAKEMSMSLGGHLEGCRIGFDLGASDYKVAAVKDGEVLYSEESPWNPKDQPDPTYHYEHLNRGLKKAAAYLPRVDAIGGSSAGVIVGNKVMVASLFRAVPDDQFSQARNIFRQLREEWKVPLEVANDGDVTALAGAMSLKANGLLGIAMGSSQAAGYLSPTGCLTGWLNELAFAPVDYNPAAAADEWSGDRGVGVMYFSQQAVNKLLSVANISVPPGMGLPERLKRVQDLMAGDDARSATIYETLGIYLGYAIAHYADFYEFQHALILGRVTTGKGGDILLSKARHTLKHRFPEVAESVTLHVPDEKSRRIGQAVAAASLPAIKP